MTMLMLHQRRDTFRHDPTLKVAICEPVIYRCDKHVQVKFHCQVLKSERDSMLDFEDLYDTRWFEWKARAGYY